MDSEYPGSAIPALPGMLNAQTGVGVNDFFDGLPHDQPCGMGDDLQDFYGTTPLSALLYNQFSAATHNLPWNKESDISVYAGLDNGR